VNSLNGSYTILTSKFRLIVHASAVLVPVLAELSSKTLVVAVLALVTVGYTISEALRLRGISLPLITSFTLRMSKGQEFVGYVARPVSLALGVILALLIFPKNIAYASIVIVGIGDPVAAYVGGKFGRRRIGRKSLEGFMTGSIAAFLATLLVVPPVLGAVGSIAGMLIELAGILDDNFTMPVGAGIAMIAVNSLLRLAVV
jgi:dolichol kinase